MVPEEKKVVCVAQNTAEISNKKGVNLPGASLTLPAISEVISPQLCSCRHT